MDNISSLRKLEEVFLSDRSDSPRNSHYGQLYHISELPVKCPRCSNFGELIEDGLVRRLYRCVDCGIFTKLTPKRQATDGKPIKCRLKNPCQGCGGNQGIIAPVDHTDRTNCQNTHQKTAASTTGRGFIVPKKGD
jgi:hypothetical protein